MNTTLKKAKTPQKAKGGKKGRKHGRNKVKCERYRNRRTLEKRKIKNLMQYCGLTYEQAVIVWNKPSAG